MMHRLVRILLLSLSCLVARESIAQNLDVGISGSGLVSVQPVDDAYVGSPYLSEGIGGVGFGFGAGLNVITPGGFVAAVEYSTARFEQEQSGRLVGGSSLSGEVPHTTRLHDSLLTGLGGVALGSGQTRVLVLGGLGAKLDSPTVDGDPREAGETNHDRGLPFVATGGFDVLRSFNQRASAVVGVRYLFNDRAENQRYLGVGQHILRIGAGIRVRIGG